MGQNPIGTTRRQQTPTRQMNLTTESGIGAQSAAPMGSGYAPINLSSINTLSPKRGKQMTKQVANGPVPHLPTTT
jgi:hypothetical protein